MSHSALRPAELRPSPVPSSDASPIVWLLQGARLGDNQQVLALGAALEARFGWRLVVKQLKFHSGPIPGHDLARAVDHVDVAQSDSIRATTGATTGAASGAIPGVISADPWPDLVIAIGRRSAPVARWIKARGNTRGNTGAEPKGIHIQLGRFQDPLDSVDLLVTTVQYALPAATNVLHLSLPITARKQAALAEAALVFEPSFAGIGGLKIGVLVGGPSNPVQFSADDGRRLVAEALAFAEARQGTLLVATSPRTPADVVDALTQGLPPPHRLFPFESNAGERNPYPALLALCDAFVVTTDSVSMVADACLTGRETRLFALPMTPPRPLWQPSWPLAEWAGRRRNQRLLRAAPMDSLDRWYEGEVRAARAQPTRYVPIIMNHLLRERHVTLLADGDPPRLGIAELAQQELDMVASRILALLAQRRAGALRDQLALGGGLVARAATPPRGTASELGLSDLSQATP